MATHRRAWVYGVLVGALAVVVGCPLPTARTNGNGDSGTVLSTGVKLASGSIGELNSAEWQIFTEDLPDILNSVPGASVPLPEGVTLPTLTDAQAEAIEQFLDDNNVNTFDDIEGLAQRIADGEVQLPPELQELWESLASQGTTPI